jgi:hypothetical protein
MVRKAPLAPLDRNKGGGGGVRAQLSFYGCFSQLVLPSDIRKLESIRTVSAPPRQEAAPREATGDGAAPYASLVVDARGLAVRPALVFRIEDESGQEVYGSAFVSREFAVKHGMGRFVTDPEPAEISAGEQTRPLVVKGLRIAPATAAIVISNADAARLRESSENLAFLRRCQVLVIVDGAP